MKQHDNPTTALLGGAAAQAVGVDDGTFAAAPLEGVTVTLLAADTRRGAARASAT